MNETSCGSSSGEIGIRLDANPGAGVAAFVQFVIHQPRVTPHGNPLARRVEIRFGRDGVLEIAQVVADVSKQFDERDAEVGNVPFRPVRNEQRQAVENELAKTGVIFREVIDLRLDQDLRFALADGRAIQDPTGSRP